MTELTKEMQDRITKYDLLFESRLSKNEESINSLNKTCQDLRETCKEIKTDLRWLLGMTFGMNAAILGLMARGFHWFN